MEFKENYTQQLQRLNEYQKAAVFDESNACLVNANVGSGKTTVLITKVMYLHYEKQIPYEQMVVLTFTNKAADEIKERLYALEPEITEEQLWGFGTFHSVCLTMLKKMLPVENLGYTKEFMVMDPDEELGMAEQLILTYQLKIKYKNRLKKRLEQKNSKYQEEEKMRQINLVEGKVVAPEGMKVGIVAARFNEIIVNKLLGGAVDGLVRHGVEEENITAAWVPGAFEIPITAQKMAQSGKYDAIICVGAVIRGDTSHYDLVCNESAKGIAQVELATGIPVLFGVITTENIEQAIARAGSKAGNKGYDCALSAIEMVNLMKQL